MAEPQANPSSNMIQDVYTGQVEKTYFKSPMVSDSYELPYNPDDLYKKSGDYSIYEDMLNDDQVTVCMQLKKDLVLGAGFDFISGDDDQEEIVEFLKDNLNDSCLVEGMEEILSAYENGFSITEKIFGLNEDSKVVLKKLQTRHPNSWMIYQDDFGNVTKYEQNTVAGYKEIDPKSIIHYVNNRKYQNPYGKSDLRSAYAAWFAKRQVVRYYAIYLEKAASPTPVAKYDKNAPDSAVTKIYNTIKRLQASTAMAIPKEIEVEFLESKSNGEAYSKAINIFNMFIGRSLFIPDLLGLSGSETSGGSYSLGKEQINMFFMHIGRRRAVLENLINKHIVWPMVVSNFGFVENYPKFRLKPIDDMKAIELAKVWLDAVKSRVFPASQDEVNYFRSLCKFPESELETTEDEPTENEPEENEPENKAEQEISEKPKEPETEKRTFGKVFNLPSGDYHRKCDFKKIETKLKDYDNSIMIEAMPIIKKQFSDIYDQIQKKGIIKNQDIAKIDKIQVKFLKELKNVLKNSFISIYKDGQVLAQSELMKSNFRTPIAHDAFLDLLEEETFQYIGDYAYTIKKKIRQQLVEAVKDGKPLSSVLDVLDDEGKKLAQVSLERFARTKHTETMNKGRLAFFEDSGVVAAYQYSAILDDVTSAICRGLDGKIFQAGTEPIPPMHFNCRSLLIPITKYEEYKPSEKAGGMDIDKFIEENKGSGFSKYAKLPTINDPGVEFTTEKINDLTDETTYSKDGKPFLTTVVIYKSEDRSEIKSVRQIRLDDGPEV